MLLLLRNIRRKLINNDNKVITYLLYAVGEITLVVIGILIAVSIDDWNEGRKDLAAQRVLLIEVLDALKQDSIGVSVTLNVAKRTYNVYQKLYDVRKGNLSPDSLTDLHMMRRSSIRTSASQLNYPDLAILVLDPQLKRKVQSYYETLYTWDALVDNYNLFVENIIRTVLRERQLLVFEFFYQQPYNYSSKYD